MKIAICDDELIQLQLLKKYCSTWLIENNLNCTIKTFSCSEAFLFAYEDEKDYDILLLDIQMKDLSGIDLAKKLRDTGDNVSIIFITGIKDFVFEGYHVQAIDYILKPIDENKLKCALSRALDNLQKKESHIFIQKDKELVRIKEKDIYYIESIGHSICIYTKNGVYQTNKGISIIEKELAEDFFYKCHRSYIINIIHIDSISKNDVKINNSLIPIARGKWEDLNKAFLKYYRGEIC